MSLILIKSATLLDGTGKPRYLADLLLENDKIAAINANLTVPEAEQINAKGLFLTPGFIDVHSHSDFSILVNPYAEGKTFQGITTEVTGNCGQSAFPLIGECKKHIQKSWDRFGLKLDWEDLPAYKKRLEEKGTAVNLAPLMGQGNIRASVMGYKEGPPSKAELEKMEQLARKAMEAGAFGMSTGLIYLPGTFSGEEEIIAVMKQVGKKKGIYATHLRNEGDTLQEAIEEAIQIAHESSTSLQLSHLKTWGPQNWHKCESVMQQIELARNKGLSVHFDRYPYTAAYTDLDAILPNWIYEGGKDKEIARLKDQALRSKIKAELKKLENRQNDYWKTIVVSTVVTEKNKSFEGKSIQSIAESKNMEPIEALFQILIEEHLEVGAVFFAMCEQNLKSIYQNSHCMIGSDSCARPFNGPLAEGKFHPRTYGTFPRFFAEYVKSGLLSWEEAIYRSCGLAADKFQIAKRGKLLPGYYADLVLFDPGRIKDKATFENPVLPPEGIQQVWVNGKQVVQNGHSTKALPGKLLLKNE